MERQRRKRVLGQTTVPLSREDEITILQKKYIEENPSRTGMPGFIHEYVPLTSAIKWGMWTDAQIRYAINLMARCNRSGGLSVMIADSTGTLCSKRVSLLKGAKRLFLYTMVMYDAFDNRRPRPPSLSIGDFMTSAQSVPTLLNFFRRWVYHLVQLTRSKHMRPNIICVDWALPLLMGTCEGFNRIHLGAYIRECWQIIHGHRTVEDIRSLSGLRFCAGHMQHNTKLRLKKANVSDSKLVGFVMSCFATLIRSTSLKAISELLLNMLVLFGSPTRTSIVEKAYNWLTNLISQTDADRHRDKMIEKLEEDIESVSSVTFTCFQ